MTRDLKSTFERARIPYKVRFLAQESLRAHSARVVFMIRDPRHEIMLDVGLVFDLPGRNLDRQNTIARLLLKSVEFQVEFFLSKRTSMMDC